MSMIYRLRNEGKTRPSRKKSAQSFGPKESCKNCGYEVSADFHLIHNEKFVCPVCGENDYERKWEGEEEE